jgi:hypothetical protein
MRKVFASVAGRTTTGAALTNSQTGAVASFLVSATGFQATGPFVLIVEPGTANEEWILCDSRATTTVTINASGRGYVGAAVAHNIGVPVSALGVDYLVYDEFNRTANLFTAAGDFLGFDGSLNQKLAIGAVNGQLLKKLASNATGLEWNVVGSMPVGAPALTDGATWYNNSGDAAEGLLTYDGISTQLPWNSKWGLVAQPGIQPSSQTNITTGTDVTGMTVTFTAVQRRWYKYTWIIDIDLNGSVGNATVNFELRDGANSTLQAWGLITQGGGSPVNMHYYKHTLIRQESAGSVTRKIWCAGAGIGVNIGFRSPVILGQLWVEDNGPVTGAPT